MKELMKISELYIESQGRPLIRASMELEQMEQAKKSTKRRRSWVRASPPSPSSVVQALPDG